MTSSPEPALASDIDSVLTSPAKDAPQDEFEKTAAKKKKATQVFKKVMKFIQMSKYDSNPNNLLTPMQRSKFDEKFAVVRQQPRNKHRFRSDDAATCSDDEDFDNFEKSGSVAPGYFTGRSQDEDNQPKEGPSPYLPLTMLSSLPIDQPFPLLDQGTSITLTSRGQDRDFDESQLQQTLQFRTSREKESTAMKNQLKRASQRFDETLNLGVQKSKKVNKQGPQSWKKNISGSEYFYIKNKILEIKKKKEHLKKLEPSQQKVKLGIELEMKEKNLHKRIIKSFSNIKRHRDSQDYSESRQQQNGTSSKDKLQKVLTEQEKVLENVIKLIVEPCERINKAQDQITYMQMNSDKFSSYFQNLKQRIPRHEKARNSLSDSDCGGLSAKRSSTKRASHVRSSLKGSLNNAGVNTISAEVSVSGEYPNNFLTTSHLEQQKLKIPPNIYLRDDGQDTVSPNMSFTGLQNPHKDLQLEKTHLFKKSHYQFSRTQNRFRKPGNILKTRAGFSTLRQRCSPPPNAGEPTSQKQFTLKQSLMSPIQAFQSLHQNQSFPTKFSKKTPPNGIQIDKSEIQYLGAEGSNILIKRGDEEERGVVCNVNQYQSHRSSNITNHLVATSPSSNTRSHLPKPAGQSSKSSSFIQINRGKRQQFPKKDVLSAAKLSPFLDMPSEFQINYKRINESNFDGSKRIDQKAKSSNALGSNQPRNIKTPFQTLSPKLASIEHIKLEKSPKEQQKAVAQNYDLQFVKQRNNLGRNRQIHYKFSRKASKELPQLEEPQVLAHNQDDYWEQDKNGCLNFQQRENMIKSSHLTATHSPQQIKSQGCFINNQVKVRTFVENEDQFTLLKSSKKQTQASYPHQDAYITVYTRHPPRGTQRNNLHVSKQYTPICCTSESLSASEVIAEAQLKEARREKSVSPRSEEEQQWLGGQGLHRGDGMVYSRSGQSPRKVKKALEGGFQSDGRGVGGQQLQYGGQRWINQSQTLQNSPQISIKNDMNRVQLNQLSLKAMIQPRNQPLPQAVHQKPKSKKPLKSPPHCNRFRNSDTQIITTYATLHHKVGSTCGKQLQNLTRLDQNNIVSNRSYKSSQSQRRKVNAVIGNKQAALNKIQYLPSVVGVQSLDQNERSSVQYSTNNNIWSKNQAQL